MVCRHKFIYKICLIPLILFSLYICFCQLGSSSFYDLDEAYRVQLSKDLFNNTNLDNTVKSATFGRLYNPIPALLVNLSFNLFGESELSARLFPALAGFLTIVLTFIFAKSLYKSNMVGLFSALVLATNYQFIFNRGVRSADGYAIPIFFMLAFIFLAWKGLKNIKFFYLSAIPFGLLGLSEAFGLLCLLGIAIILLFQLLSKKFLRLKQWSLWLLLLLITVTPWLIYLFITKQYLNYLSFFISFIVSNIIRLKIFNLGFLQQLILSGKIDLAAPNARDPFILWNVLKLGFFPWSIMLVPAFIFLFIRLLKEKYSLAADKLVFSWIITTTIIIMAVTLFTRSWWANILCPALAILVGKFIYDFVWNFRNNDGLLFTLSAWFISMLTLTNLLQVYQTGYSSVSWMEERGLAAGSFSYNVNNPLLWILCLTVVVLLIQVSIKILSRTYTNKYIIARVSVMLFFLVSSANIIYLINNSQNKSEMDIIRSLLNNKKAIYTGKKLVLCNITLLGGKSRLTSERKERWSDYYYLNKIDIPKAIVNRDLSLMDISLSRNIKDNIYLMEREDYNNLLKLGQEKEMKINIIWLGSEYVLFT